MGDLEGDALLVFVTASHFSYMLPHTFPMYCHALQDDEMGDLEGDDVAGSAAVAAARGAADIAAFGNVLDEFLEEQVGWLSVGWVVGS